LGKKALEMVYGTFPALPRPAVISVDFAIEQRMCQFQMQRFPANFEDSFSPQPAVRLRAGQFVMTSWSK
jgi:hypothetical protein